MKSFLKGIFVLALTPLIIIIFVICWLIDVIRHMGGCEDYYFLNNIDLLMNKWLEL